MDGSRRNSGCVGMGIGGRTSRGCSPRSFREQAKKELDTLRNDLSPWTPSRSHSVSSLGLQADGTNPGMDDFFNSIRKELAILHAQLDADRASAARIAAEEGRVAGKHCETLRKEVSILADQMTEASQAWKRVAVESQQTRRDCEDFRRELAELRMVDTGAFAASDVTPTPGLSATASSQSTEDRRLEHVLREDMKNLAAALWKECEGFHEELSSVRTAVCTERRCPSAESLRSEFSLLSTRVVGECAAAMQVARTAAAEVRTSMTRHREELRVEFECLSTKVSHMISNGGAASKLGSLSKPSVSNTAADDALVSCAPAHGVVGSASQCSTASDAGQSDLSLLNAKLSDLSLRTSADHAAFEADKVQLNQQLDALRLQVVTLTEQLAQQGASAASIHKLAIDAATTSNYCGDLCGGVSNLCSRVESEQELFRKESETYRRDISILAQEVAEQTVAMAGLLTHSVEVAAESNAARHDCDELSNEVCMLNARTVAEQAAMVVLSEESKAASSQLAIMYQQFPEVVESAALQGRAAGKAAAELVGGEALAEVARFEIGVSSEMSAHSRSCQQFAVDQTRLCNEVKKYGSEVARFGGLSEQIADQKNRSAGDVACLHDELRGLAAYFTESNGKFSDELATFRRSQAAENDNHATNKQLAAIRKDVSSVTEQVAKQKHSIAEQRTSLQRWRDDLCKELASFSTRDELSTLAEELRHQSVSRHAEIISEVSTATKGFHAENMSARSMRAPLEMISQLRDELGSIAAQVADLKDGSIEKAAATMRDHDHLKTELAALSRRVALGKSKDACPAENAELVLVRSELADLAEQVFALRRSCAGTVAAEGTATGLHEELAKLAEQVVDAKDTASELATSECRRQKVQLSAVRLEVSELSEASTSMNVELRDLTRQVAKHRQGKAAAGDFVCDDGQELHEELASLAARLTYYEEVSEEDRGFMNLELTSVREELSALASQIGKLTTGNFSMHGNAAETPAAAAAALGLARAAAALGDVEAQVQASPEGNCKVMAPLEQLRVELRAVREELSSVAAWVGHEVGLSVERASGSTRKNGQLKPADNSTDKDEQQRVSRLATGAPGPLSSPKHGPSAADRLLPFKRAQAGSSNEKPRIAQFGISEESKVAQFGNPAEGEESNSPTTPYFYTADDEFENGEVCADDLEADCEVTSISSPLQRAQAWFSSFQAQSEANSPDMQLQLTPEPDSGFHFFSDKEALDGPRPNVPQQLSSLNCDLAGLSEKTDATNQICEELSAEFSKLSARVAANLGDAKEQHADTQRHVMQSRDELSEMVAMSQELGSMRKQVSSLTGQVLDQSNAAVDQIVDVKAACDDLRSELTEIVAKLARGDELDSEIMARVEKSEEQNAEIATQAYGICKKVKQDLTGIVVKVEKCEDQQDDICSQVAKAHSVCEMLKNELLSVVARVARGEELSGEVASQASTTSGVCEKLRRELSYVVAKVATLQEADLTRDMSQSPTEHGDGCAADDSFTLPSSSHATPSLDEATSPRRNTDEATQRRGLDGAARDHAAQQAASASGEERHDAPPPPVLRPPPGPAEPPAPAERSRAELLRERLEALQKNAKAPVQQLRDDPKEQATTAIRPGDDRSDAPEEWGEEMAEDKDPSETGDAAKAEEHEPAAGGDRAGGWDWSDSDEERPSPVNDLLYEETGARDDQEPQDSSNFSSDASGSPMDRAQAWRWGIRGESPLDSPLSPAGMDQGWTAAGEMADEAEDVTRQPAPVRARLATATAAVADGAVSPMAATSPVEERSSGAEFSSVGERPPARSALRQAGRRHMRKSVSIDELVETCEFGLPPDEAEEEEPSEDIEASGVSEADAEDQPPLDHEFDSAVEGRGARRLSVDEFLQL